MATVTPTILSITLYTVQSCDFLISDVRAAKKIEEFGFLTTKLLVGEDVLAVNEKPVKSITKKVSEKAIVTDKITRSPVKKALEVIRVGDKHNISNAKKVTESARFVEKLTNSFAKKTAESFMIGEKAVRSFHINKKEALAVIDVWGRTGRFHLLLAEGVLIGDKSIKNLTVRINDKLVIGSKFTNFTNKQVGESILFTDKTLFEGFKKINELLFVDGKIANFTNKQIKEVTGLADRIIKQTALSKREALSLVDFFTRVAAFNIKSQEYIGILPKTNKNIAVKHSELLAVSSKLFKFFEALKKENTGVNDKFSGKSVFKRTFAEKIYNASKLLKTFNLSRKEFIEAFDAYIRHANAVVSDIYLGMGEMTLEEFLSKISSPPGYDKFIEFVVGEYEYQNALVRMVIESGSAKSEPLIYDMAVNVDIDDTVDRGTAQITDITKPTTVKFNKHYYHPPEVSVALKGGTGTDILTAEIVEIREDGFDISLYNSSRARVSGSVTWTAVGY